MQNISAIKNEFAHCDILKVPDLIKEYENDSRIGVQKIIESHRKKVMRHHKEMERLQLISFYENRYYDQGCAFIAGMDEVGRGPLAGPVVACALILKKGWAIAGINDSKKISAKNREVLAAEIKKSAVATGIGVVDVLTIDRINILNATKKAMSLALEDLSTVQTPDIVLIDALTIATKIRQKAIVKGDEKSISIAAASIVAKVTRDQMMADFALLYPQYGFEQNKGYGSQSHIEAIKAFGPCPIHRNSFLKNILE